MRDKAPQEWTVGQWGFLIVASCSTSLWRFFSTTQGLPYNVFFWGDLVVTLLSAICLFAFPSSFQDGAFAKKAIARLRHRVGIAPYVLALVPIVVAFTVATFELGFGKQMLLPYSPIQYIYHGRNYPYPATMWLAIWMPRIIHLLAVTYATALVLSIPNRKKRVIVTVAFFTSVALTIDLGVWFSTRVFGAAIWGSRLGDSSFMMTQLNQLINVVIGIFLSLRTEKVLRPSLTYFGVAGILQGGYFMIVRISTNWYAAGASLIAAAITLFLLESKIARPETSAEGAEPDS